jgi:quinol monooxygenase YgiN
MAFIQLLTFETSNYDEIKSLSTEYDAAIADKTTVKRYYVSRDRENPQRYVIAVFFDSYEAAMENSNLPETGEFAAKQSKLVSNLSFQNLDVIEEHP